MINAPTFPPPPAPLREESPPMPRTRGASR